MSPLLIAIMAFVCVAALVGAVAVTFRESAESKFDDRLASLMGGGTAREKKPKPSLLAQPIEDRTGIGERLVKRIARLRLLFEQADTRMTPRQFVLLSGALAAVAFALGDRLVAHGDDRGGRGLIDAVRVVDLSPQPTH